MARMHDLGGKYTAAAKPRQQVSEKAAVAAEAKKKKKTAKESNDSEVVAAERIYKSEDNYTIRMLSSGITKDVSGSFLSLVLETTMAELNMHGTNALDNNNKYDTTDNRCKRDLATRILEQKYKWKIIRQQSTTTAAATTASSSSSSKQATVKFVGLDNIAPPTPPDPPRRPRKLDDGAGKPGDFSVLDVNEDEECSMFTMRRSDGREGDKQDDSLPGATLTDDSSASTDPEEVDKYHQQRHYVLTDRTIVDRLNGLKGFQYHPTMKRREVHVDPHVPSSKIGGNGMTSSCLKRRESSSSSTKIATARDQDQVFDRARKDDDNSPSSSRKTSVGSSHLSPSRVHFNLKDAKKKLRKLREAETKGRKKSTHQSPTRTCDLPSEMTSSSTNNLPADLPTVIGLPPPPFAQYRRSKSSSSTTKRREKKSNSGTTSSSSKYTRRLSGSSSKPSCYF